MGGDGCVEAVTDGERRLGHGEERVRAPVERLALGGDKIRSRSRISS